MNHTALKSCQCLRANPIVFCFFFLSIKSNIFACKTTYPCRGALVSLVLWDALRQEVFVSLTRHPQQPLQLLSPLRFFRKLWRTVNRTSVIAKRPTKISMKLMPVSLNRRMSNEANLFLRNSNPPAHICQRDGLPRSRSGCRRDSDSDPWTCRSSWIRNGGIPLPGVVCSRRSPGSGRSSSLE